MIVGTLQQDGIPETVTYAQVYAYRRVYIRKQFFVRRTKPDFFHYLKLDPFFISIILSYRTKKSPGYYRGLICS
jgi:hypothetical protein